MAEQPSGSHPVHRSLPAPLLAELSAAEIRITTSDPTAEGPHWGAMHKLLLKAKVQPAEIMPLVAGRDREGLSRLLARMRGEVAESAPLPATGADGPGERNREPVDADTLRHAMKAFRQRLKLMRLDAESKLGVGPMSGGRKHGIDAILPPREYPGAVWETLADQGKLRRAGDGFFGLAEESA